MFERGLGLWGWPLTPLYSALVLLRNWSFDWGLRQQFGCEVPVLSIGNLSMGGAGKTPITRDLAKRLVQMNRKCVVLSRGYKRQSAQDEWVDPSGSAARYGDEPLLLARGESAPQVWVSNHRARFAPQLVQQTGCDVLLLDDGFQHRALIRDADWVLVDVSQGPPRPFPVKWFREGGRALKRAHTLVFTRVPEFGQLPTWAEKLANQFRPLSQFQTRFVSQHLQRIDGFCQPLSVLQGRPIGVYCGLAQPQKFLDGLRHLGADIRLEWRLPDHGVLDQKPFLAACRKAHVDWVVTTEKDAVKLDKKTSSDIIFHFIPISVLWDQPQMLEKNLADLISSKGRL